MSEWLSTYFERWKNLEVLINLTLDDKNYNRFECYICVLCHFDRPSNVEIGVKLKYWMFVVVIILLTITEFCILGHLQIQFWSKLTTKEKTKIQFSTSYSTAMKWHDSWFKSCVRTIFKIWLDSCLTFTNTISQQKKPRQNTPG